MAGKVRLEGFRELDRALSELPKATERSVLRRVAKKALEPVLEDAQRLAPVDDGQLRDSIQIASAGLTPKARRHDRGRPKMGVRLYVGTASPYAYIREFGTHNAPAHPFMRPAWELNKDRMLEGIKADLKIEIEKSAARLAKKRAKNGK